MFSFMKNFSGKTEKNADISANKNAFSALRPFQSVMKRHDNIWRIQYQAGGSPSFMEGVRNEITSLEDQLVRAWESTDNFSTAISTWIKENCEETACANDAPASYSVTNLALYRISVWAEKQEVVIAAYDLRDMRMEV